MNYKFGKDYFIGASKSNYIDYRIRKFSDQVNDIVKILDLKEDDRILDFGCATGALLKELKDRKFKNLKGTDISNWAIEYGKETYKLDNELEFYNRNLLCETSDYIIMLDVIEHLPDYELETVFKLARKGLKKKLLIRAPVSCQEGEDFFLDISKNDKTHIQIHTRDWWIDKIESFGFIFLEEIFENTIFSSSGVFCGVFQLEVDNMKINTINTIKTIKERNKISEAK